MEDPTGRELPLDEDNLEVRKVTKKKPMPTLSDVLNRLAHPFLLGMLAQGALLGALASALWGPRVGLQLVAVGVVAIVGLAYLDAFLRVRGVLAKPAAPKEAPP